MEIPTHLRRKDELAGSLLIRYLHAALRINLIHKGADRILLLNGNLFAIRKTAVGNRAYRYRR